jgi:predicted ATPase
VGVREAGEQPQLATLVTALVARRLLLVLDNGEHVIEACAELIETLLRACPISRSWRPAASRCASLAKSCGGCGRWRFRRTGLRTLNG